MIINYSDQEVIKNKKSIFIAGPTPRDRNVESWRTIACEKLNEFGFDGVVYVPEYSTWKPKADYVDQAMWEREALTEATVIMFWVPRVLPDMPGFTTNVEFGYWLHSGKVIYGRPNDASKIKYLDWLYKEDYDKNPINNLEVLLKESIILANYLYDEKNSEILPLDKRKILERKRFIYKKEVKYMKDWTNYQTRTYGGAVCNLLIEFLNNYNVDNAIDLGCGSGNETVYMIKKGIKVLAIDRQLNEEFILNRLSTDQKKLITFKESSFEDVELPKTKLLTAFFSIPFCNPKNFDELWNKIYNSIEEDGYFVGQLFGDRDAWNVVDSINTFPIEKVKEYLKKYKIIKLEEVEYVRESDNKKWHFYDIIAQKKVVE